MASERHSVTPGCVQRKDEMEVDGNKIYDYRFREQRIGTPTPIVGAWNRPPVYRQGEYLANIISFLRADSYLQRIVYRLGGTAPFR